MSESAAVIHWNNAKHYRCPFDRGYCDGAQCMAWVNKEDGEGKPTGEGRCGMVPFSMPSFSPNVKPLFYDRYDPPPHGTPVLVRNSEHDPWKSQVLDVCDSDEYHSWRTFDGEAWIYCAKYDEHLLS